jgi:hypothetical protein
VVPQLIAAGAATAVTLDGAVAAASVDHDGAATTVFATDGVNLVSVNIPAGNIAPELVPGLVSALVEGAGAA